MALTKFKKHHLGIVIKLNNKNQELNLYLYQK